MWTCCRCGCNNVEDRCIDCEHVVCKETVPKTAKVLIVGCARSGSKYIAEVLKMHGAVIGHEMYAQDGMAHCMCAVDGVSPVLAYNDRWVHVRHEDFQRIAHQVRAPLPAIGSIAKFRADDRFTDYHMDLIEKHTSARRYQNVLEFAMHYWLDWNELCRKAARFSYRVEDVKLLDRSVEPLFDAIGKKMSESSIRCVDTKTNTFGETPPIRWSALHRVDAWLANQIAEDADRYGYSVMY